MLPNRDGAAGPLWTGQQEGCDILESMPDGRHRRDAQSFQNAPGRQEPRFAPRTPYADAGQHDRLDQGAPVVKVPEVTVYFWVVKLATTAMGEAISDYLVNDWNKYLGVLAGFIVFAVAISFQLRGKTYSTWRYWITVSMVAVFGTMAADVLHVVIGLPYALSFALYAVLLTATFTAWYRSERTLDIHTISTPRREVFYWLTVVFTFAMGTAVGDLTSITVSLGYLGSAFLFAGLILIPLAAWRLGASQVATFWVAYVLTRPIGASFADYFGMPKDHSGLGLGHITTSVVLIAAVTAGIWFLKSSGRDAQQPQPAPAATAAPGSASASARRTPAGLADGEEGVGARR
jgi:uncharacterized membrane-anchored protein